MKKPLPKIVVWTLIPVIFFATVLCCRFTKADFDQGLAYFLGKTANAMECSACHAQQTKSNSQDHSNCCITKAPADTLQKVSFNIPKEIVGLAAVDFLPQGMSFKTNLAFNYLNGPPGYLADTPLYLPLHNFRL